MKLFAWLKRKMAAVPLTCPRCLGKGQVDKDDIIRLKQESKWDVGICAYCNGSGNVPEDMLSKVPVDATWLTNNLSEPERTALINKHSQETETADLQHDDCPVSEQNRLWLEHAFLSLLDLFGKEKMLQRKMLLPHYSDFPVHYDGSEQSAFESMKIVAAQMEVPYDRIELNFYEDGVREIRSGGVGGGHIYLEGDKENPSAAGLYWGRGENNKYEIWLNYDKLSQPETMVAILAHEIAHIKLLGENRIEDNDEYF